MIIQSLDRQVVHGLSKWTNTLNKINQYPQINEGDVIASKSVIITNDDWKSIDIVKNIASMTGWQFYDKNNNNNNNSNSGKFANCQHCNGVVLLENMIDHLNNICIKVAIECPLCKKILKEGKSELTNHWDNDCIKYSRVVLV